MTKPKPANVRQQHFAPSQEAYLAILDSALTTGDDKDFAYALKGLEMAPGERLVSLARRTDSAAEDLIDVLIKKRPAWIDATDSFGDSLATVAASQGRHRLLGRLLAAGSNPFQSRQDDPEEEHGSDFTLLDDATDVASGRAPSDRDIKKTRLTILSAMIQRGSANDAAVDQAVGLSVIRDLSNDQTELARHLWEHFPVSPQLAVTNVLLGARINVMSEIVNCHGSDKTHGTRLKLLKSVLKRVQDPDDVMDDFGGPLQVAAYSHFPDAVQLLLKHGFDPNGVAQEDGSTPLHAAAASLDSTTLKLLLAAGGDPAARDLTGRTPLHAVIDNDGPTNVLNTRGQPKAGFTDTVRTLIRAGAPVQAGDHDGHTAADLARRAGLPDSVVDQLTGAVALKAKRPKA